LESPVHSNRLFGQYAIIGIVFFPAVLPKTRVGNTIDTKKKFGSVANLHSLLSFLYEAAKWRGKEEKRGIEKKGTPEKSRQKW